MLPWVSNSLSAKRKKQTDGKKAAKGKAKSAGKETEEMAEFKKRLSHSVRMPMSIIMGYGEVLMNGKCSPEEEKECIRKICQNIKYLNLTYHMLLEEEQEQECVFDAGKVVQQFIDQVEEYVHKKNVRIGMNPQKGHTLMWGNPVELMRILYNLMENSLKYMAGGTSIYITVDHVDGQAMIVYRDDGKGVKHGEAKQLTDKHYQGSNAAEKEDNPGFGYGLYMVQEMVERWKGTMQIKSAEGESFSVYFFFPEERDRCPAET